MKTPDQKANQNTVRDLSLGGVLLNGLKCRCPQCLRGNMFKGFATIRDRCPVCGLGLDEHDIGDGPVVPMMLVIGTIVVSMALYVEFTYLPPVWVHVVLWVPFVMVLTAVVLKRVKSIVVQLQYRFRETDKKTLPGGQ